MGSPKAEGNLSSCAFPVARRRVGKERGLMSWVALDWRKLFIKVEEFITTWRIKEVGEYGLRIGVGGELTGAVCRPGEESPSLDSFESIHGGSWR